MVILKLIGRGLALGLLLYIFALVMTTYLKYRRRAIEERREDNGGVQRLFDGEK